jgi:hypothetical protein
MSYENNISPDIDCLSCGGEGVDADPYGQFDYDCIIACPDCHTSQPTQSDALDNPTPELVQAVARGMYSECSKCMSSAIPWEYTSNQDIWIGQATAALTAAAAHLKGNTNDQ